MRTAVGEQWLRGVAAALWLGTTAGCVGAPRRVATPPAPATFKPRQELEVWQGNRVITLHGVRIEADSLSGVPSWKAPTCDSCRTAFPLGTIDSLRLVRNERAWMFTAALPFVALGVVMVAWRASEGD